MFQVLIIIFGSIPALPLQQRPAAPAMDRPPAACPLWQRVPALLAFLAATIAPDTALPLVNLMNMVAGRGSCREAARDAMIIWFVMILQIGLRSLSC